MFHYSNGSRTFPSFSINAKSTLGEKGEFMSELSNLLQSADRLDRMMRSDEANPTKSIFRNLRRDYESVSDLESIASDRTLRNSSYDYK